MQNSLRSRKKLNAEIMYDMRRQGMSNKQIAENLGIAVSTVYDHIGKKSMAVKHAEEQNKPPVVDVPVVNTAVISAENGFKPFVPEAVTLSTPPCEQAAFGCCKRKIHYAGRALPVHHRHQRRNGGAGGRREHGNWHAGQGYHPAVYRGA